ncbi:MAG: DUF1176 domain-containing protein [Brevundimonas sp.]
MTGILALAMLLAACGGDAPSDPSVSARPQPEAGPIAASAAVASRSESRAFRDWRAVCDNGADCVAHAGSATSGWLMVRMNAGPDARPRILADLPEISGVALRLVIDGRSHALSAASGDAGGQTVPAAETAAVLSRLAAARDIRLVAPDFEAAVPTAGVSAALLWIDERQGRLDTVTALLRRGDRPASAVPAPPALPVVTAAPPVAQSGFGDSDQTLPAALEALPAVKACRAETAGQDWIQSAVMSARLDASTELWAVPCFSGAYNIGHDWYLTGPGGRAPRPAALASSNGETSAGTINGGYSPETRTLTAFARGRGIGDCGVAQTWTWTGRAFVLTTEAEMQDCQGIPADQWPTTWRSR